MSNGLFNTMINSAMTNGPSASSINNGYYSITNANLTSPNLTVEKSGIVEICGKDADVVINGVSLSATLQGIQERLNILKVDPELEAKWGQLRELGEQYRSLESEILQKQRMWETLQR